MNSSVKIIRMEKSMKKILLMGLLIAGLVAGFGYAKDAQEQKISQDTHQLKKDYQAKIEKDLKEIGRQIKHLERKAEKAEVKSKGEIDQAVKDLKVRKAGLDKKLTGLKKSTGDGWKDLRKGVDDGINSLKKTVQDATNRFKDKD